MMRKLSKNLTMYICMFVAVFCAMTLKAEAANVTSGTLGDNGGITWTYDADTKTLTVTGEDSGLDGNRVSNTDSYHSLFVDICGDVEVIKVQNCKLKGSARGLFSGLESLRRIEFDGFDTSEVTSMCEMFYECSNLESLDVSDFNTSEVTDMSRMFSGCLSLTALDVSEFDTANVNNMKWMFSGCQNVSELDVSGFNTSKVTDMSAMFNYCLILNDLDLSSFNVTSVTNMSKMFSYCVNLSSLDLSSFKPINVTDMSRMFSGCEKLESLKLSNFDTSNATDMGSMFSECTNLKSLDLRAFVTANVTDISSMFFNCKSLADVDVSSFNTTKVKYMRQMFYGCSSLKSLDLSNFDTSKVLEIKDMFYMCSSLEELNLSGMDFSKVTKSSNVFSLCSNLAIIYTPEVIPETLSVYLGRTYADLQNNRTTYLTTDFCDTTLINVDYLVTDIELSAESLSIYVGKSGQLSAMVLPEKAIFKTVTWKSSNTAVATVDATGKVTAVSPGTTTITATATDGSGVSASCEVIVTQPVTEITLSKTSLSLKAGVTESLTATVTPSNANNKVLTWKSTNTAVATVDANGKVTAVAPGSAAITATAADGSGVSASCSVRVFSEQEWQVRAFVERMYTVALGRASESTGINYWTEELLSHRKDGAAISVGFIMSEEFVSRNYNNEDYLKVLYRTFFDREPDTGGMNFWLEQMKAGRSRKSVLAGFVNSKEFTEICESYGITRGTMEDDATATGAGQFVERLYTIALERPSEPTGLEDWAQRINNKINTPEEVAKLFFLSEEYVGKKTSNDKYVETLYLVFMDRASEEGGKTFWVGQLNQGVSRESVLEGFAQSEEFKEIMARYGL